MKKEQTITEEHNNLSKLFDTTFWESEPIFSKSYTQANLKHIFYKDTEPSKTDFLHCRESERIYKLPMDELLLLGWEENVKWTSSSVCINYYMHKPSGSTFILCLDYNTYLPFLDLYSDIDEISKPLMAEEIKFSIEELFLRLEMENQQIIETKTFRDEYKYHIRQKKLNDIRTYYCF
ncbi:hypothetical protein [Rufibacter sp. DG15C]|uniref:hypothetical protein n=1 Tax=Rufibacter sp. DG15C TaxID=1379909 RepID=UPI000A4853CF|nr:hypothetical protein [Rufibacter sp. DG15C]